MKNFWITTLLLLVTLTAGAKVKVGKMYLYGFAASFRDSTVYLTSIQQIDSVSYENKHKFLMGRNEYSNQLRNHLRAQGFTHPTCITVFSKNQKDIEKKYLKLKKKYSKPEVRYNIKYITPSEFSYETVKYNQTSY